MKIRKRKCKICHEQFQPSRQMQPVCSVKCAIEKVKMDKAKKRREYDRKEREKLKTRSQWLRETQQIFNRFIRERDKRLPCISCGKHHTGQYHAGHFYTTASRPDLRFGSRGEDNCHKQCSACNSHLSGNIHAYRENLILKIGQERVDALEKVGRSDWSIEEIKEIKKKYQQKIKELGNENKADNS